MPIISSLSFHNLEAAPLSTAKSRTEFGSGLS